METPVDVALQELTQCLKGDVDFNAKLENALLIITNTDNDKILFGDHEKTSQILIKLSEIVSQYDVNTFPPSIQTFMFSFCQKFLSLPRKVDLRVTAFKYSCNIMTHYLNPQLFKSISDITREYIFINQETKYKLILKYIKILFSWLPQYNDEQITFWLNFAFEYVFNQYYFYPTNDEGTKIEKPKAFKKKYAEKLNTIIYKFFKSILKKDPVYNPLVHCNKFVFFGLVLYFQKLNFTDFYNIMLKLHKMDIVCLDESYEKKAEVEYFLLSVYENKCESIEKTLSNILEYLQSNAIGIFINSIFRNLSHQSDSSDKATIMKSTSLTYYISKEIFIKYKNTGLLFTNSFKFLAKHPSIHGCLIMFYASLESGHLAKNTVDSFWDQNIYNKEALCLIARILATHFFPELLSIDIKDLISFSKTYHGAKQNSRDKRLSPIFLEELESFETNPTKLLSLALKWPKLQTKLYLPTLLTAAESAKKVKFTEHFIAKAIEMKYFDFISSFIDSLVEIITNIPPEYEYNSIFINNFLIPKLKSFDLISPLFKCFTRVSQENWAIFTALFEEKLMFSGFEMILYLSENIDLIYTRFSSLLIDISDAIPLIFENQLSEQQVIQISSLLISLYSISSMKKDPSRKTFISYLNKLCMDYKQYHLVHEQIIAHYLCLYDPELADVVSIETLIAQIQGCSVSVLLFLQVLVSDKLDFNPIFPDFYKKLLKFFAESLSTSISAKRIEYLSSLCAGIILKCPHLIEDLTKIINLIENKTIKHNINDLIFSKKCESNYPDRPAFNDATYGIYVDKLISIDKVSQDSFTINLRQGASTAAYNIELSDKTLEKENISHNFEDHKPKPSQYIFTEFCRSIADYDFHFPLANAIDFIPEFLPWDCSIAVESVQRTPDDEAKIAQKTKTFPRNSSLFYGGITETPLMIIQENPDMDNAVRAIYEYPIKSSSKIGILYVKKGRIQQNDILTIETVDTTKEYNDFLQIVGDVINLKGFKQYNGKLDVKKNFNGPQSIYFSDSLVEAMFHVPTMMPTRENDAQQIQKKKHVGNDNVCIVWNENLDIPWNTGTIVSQFNNFHVVVYPQAENLLFVDVRKKVDSYEIGPIRYPMLLNTKTCGELSRWTAVLSDFLIRGFFNPLDIPHPKVVQMIQDLLKYGA